MNLSVSKQEHDYFTSQNTKGEYHGLNTGRESTEDAGDGCYEWTGDAYRTAAILVDQGTSNGGYKMETLLEIMSAGKGGKE